MTKKMHPEEKQLLKGARLLRMSGGLGYIININETQRLELMEVLRAAGFNDDNIDPLAGPLANWLHILRYLPDTDKNNGGGIHSFCVEGFKPRE